MIDDFRKYIEKYKECIDEGLLELEERLIDRMPKAVACGYMTKDDLLAVACWKGGGKITRGLKHVKDNETEDVINVSKDAFAAENPYLRMNLMRRLNGVGWSMASAILHLAYGGHPRKEQYPILDIHAIRAFCEENSHNVENWKIFRDKRDKRDEYADWFRRTAHEHNLSMRDLDRALWACDKWGSATCENSGTSRRKKAVALADIQDFYHLLGRLGGKRRLRDVNKTDIPELRVPGVYFIFENGETRDGSGTGNRVVRVGISTNLYRRLSYHLNGNRSNSIFRKIVEDALQRRDSVTDLKDAVSERIGTMSFLWVRVDDKSDRKFIERNAIGLLSAPMLSAPGCTAADPASPSWLGRHSSRKRVVRSGLWNSNHVGDGFDPGFLKTLEKRIARTARP